MTNYKEQPRRPTVDEKSTFKCPACNSPYFGPLFSGNEFAGRYCKGWPTGWDRSYYPCKGKHEEQFSAAKADQEKA